MYSNTHDCIPTHSPFFSPMPRPHTHGCLFSWAVCSTACMNTSRHAMLLSSFWLPHFCFNSGMLHQFNMTIIWLLGHFLFQFLLPLPSHSVLPHSVLLHFNPFGWPQPCLIVVFCNSVFSAGCWLIKSDIFQILKGLLGIHRLISSSWYLCFHAPLLFFCKIFKYFQCWTGSLTLNLIERK